jgi:tetratricopeptide (TPR) repeat protein
MAPEQHLGASADARADQFAFAISLWEALHGERPFAGATYAAIRAEVIAGRVREPKNRDVPAFVQRALTRSLAADPDRRWPSMDALLAALATDPRRRWRRRAVGAAVVGIFAAGVLGWGHVQASRARREAVAACANADHGLVGVWDEPRKRDVKRALLATGVPFAADAWRGVEASLDRYATAWSTASTQACEDTRVRGVAPEFVFDARSLCLARRQIDMRALVDELVAMDAHTIGHVATAVGALESIEPCLDAATAADSHAGSATPWDSVLAARVAALWPRNAKAQMLKQTGRYREAADEARSALAVATVLDYPPLTARLAATLGGSLALLGDLPGGRSELTRAVTEAERTHDETLRLSVLADLAHVLATDHEHEDEAQRWRSMIDAGMSRLDSSSRCHIASSLAEDEAMGHGNAGAAAAVARAEAAVKLCESSNPPDDHRLMLALESLAAARYMARDPERAIADLHRALPLAVRALGADNPEIAVIHGNLALMTPHRDDESVGSELLSAAHVLERNNPEDPDLFVTYAALAEHHGLRGEFERAWEYARKAHELAARVFGRDSARVASVMQTEADVLVGLGKLDDALATAREAREMALTRGGEVSDNVAALDGLMADILDRKGQPRAALALAERALKGTIAHAKTTFAAAAPHAQVGDLDVELSRPMEAIAHYRAALELIDREPEGDAGGLEQSVLGGLGETLTNLGRASEAVPLLERSLARIGARKLDPMVIAHTRFTLAVALWQSGGDRARALELARAARDDYAGAASPHAREIARVQAWLGGKRIP